MTPACTSSSSSLAQVSCKLASQHTTPDEARCYRRCSKNGQHPQPNEGARQLQSGPLQPQLPPPRRCLCSQPPPSRDTCPAPTAGPPFQRLPSMTTWTGLHQQLDPCLIAWCPAASGSLDSALYAAHQLNLPRLEARLHCSRAGLLPVSAVTDLACWPCLQMAPLLPVS